MKISEYFQAIILASSVLGLRAITAASYSKVDTRDGDFEVEDPQMKKKDIEPGYVSIQQQNLIMNIHEMYRLQVQSTNMMKLRYHIDIAKLAQSQADTCILGQYTNDNRAGGELRGVHLGRNICIGSCSWSDCINNWGNEKYNFEYGIGSRNGLGIANYTQMMLWRAIAIGCGFNSCNERPFYVCLYAYGQYNNELNLPYKSGEQCADCPNSCTKNGLCDCGGSFCTTKYMVMSPACECKYWWTI